MRFKFYLLLILMLCSGAACYSQISITDVEQLHHVAAYADGENELLKMFGKNVRFPLNIQRTNKEGVVVGVLKISRSGDIVEVATLNKVDNDLTSTFEKVVNRTKGKWVAANDSAEFSYAVIPVMFTIAGSGYTINETQKPDYFRQTIVITAVGGAPGAWAGYYEKQENALVQEVNNLVQAANYNGAIRALEELINFQPLNAAYYEPLIILNEKVGNAKEAAYYRQVRNLFIPKNSQKQN